MTTTETSSEYYGPENSVTTAEASEDDEEYTTRTRDWRRRWRRQRLDAEIEGYPTMMAESVEEDRDDDRGVCRGQLLDSAYE